MGTYFPIQTQGLQGAFCLPTCKLMGGQSEGETCIISQAPCHVFPNLDTKALPKLEYRGAINSTPLFPPVTKPLSPIVTTHTHTHTCMRTHTHPHQHTLNVLMKSDYILTSHSLPWIIHRTHYNRGHIEGVMSAIDRVLITRIKQEQLWNNASSITHLMSLPISVFTCLCGTICFITKYTKIQETILIWETIKLKNNLPSNRFNYPADGVGCRFSLWTWLLISTQAIIIHPSSQLTQLIMKHYALHLW